MMEHPPTLVLTPEVKATRELVKRAVREIEFVHAIIPTRLLARAHSLYVVIQTLERDSGEPTSIQLRWNIPPSLLSYDAAVDWVYGCVRFAWVHELNEALFLDATRRRDLHDDSGNAVFPPEDGEYNRLIDENAALRSAAASSPPRSLAGPFGPIVNPTVPMLQILDRVVAIENRLDRLEVNEIEDQPTRPRLECRHLHCQGKIVTPS